MSGRELPPPLCPVHDVRAEYAAPIDQCACTPEELDEIAAYARRGL